MKKLLFVLRTGQLYLQAAHNTTKGCTFFSDHAWLGEAYDAFAAGYDAVAERAIGLGEDPDLLAINIEAAKTAAELPLGSSVFSQALELEQSLQSVIESMGKKTVGTDNLLAGLADASEVRGYKLKQRIDE